MTKKTGDGRKTNPMMNKSTAFAFESLGLAASNLINMMRSLNNPPDPEFLDAYMRAQKAIDEMAIFLTADLSRDSEPRFLEIDIDEDL